MNTRLLVTVICLIVTGGFVYSQDAPEPKGRNNSVSGPVQSQWNKFPAWGNVGIGTTNPTEALDVRGDVKVSGTLLTNAFESTSLIRGATLNLSGNGFINGYLGLGVAVPSERLDILGNIKLSGNLSAQGLNIQTLNTNSGVFNTLTVNQTSLFNGATTFGENASFSKNVFIGARLGIGLSTPSEALDVVGNIKTSNGLFSASLSTGSASLSSLNVSGNAIFNGLIGIGTTSPSEKLHIGGNLKVDNSIFSNSLITSAVQTGQLSATGVASFAENASFTKDLLVSGRLGIGVLAPSEVLDVNGNLKLTGGIRASSLIAGQGTFTSGLSAGNTTVTGSLQVSGQLTSQSISLADVTATNNVSVGSNLVVTGQSQLNGGATIGGSSTVSNLQVTGTLNAGTISIAELNTNGSANIGQNLTANGNATVAQNLTVNGASTLGGNVNVTGNVKAGIIEATEFRTTSGGSPFNFDNAVISQTLSVGSTRPFPSNYKIAVGGAIIATGLDLKTPSKWPDYVFEAGYVLVPLSELEQFIKENGHLPAVPSAQEMKEKEHYSVAEMDAKLLEKVEELTLYVIELKKEIEALKKKP